ncbi:MAG: L,D-transpeptidase [Fibrobacteres bacterium]|nr:L,D-transpeptidase [Fibrobacterota bacterium]
MTVITVKAKEQKLFVHCKGKLLASFRVSTAKRGIGAEKGSLQTPPGRHRIYKKIGARAAKGAVFKDRVNTGEIWDGKSQFGDLILSRIIQIEGVEPGINKGGNVDTLERYVYFHGTNHVKNIGKPSSHGCITMRCSDIIKFFKLVKKGDHVIIQP